jgi:hypothetical protein
LVLLLAYFFWWSRWFDEVVLFRESFLEVVQSFFVLYVLVNVVSWGVLWFLEKLPLGVVRETVLVVCLVDALFLGALTVITGGFDSIMFWLYLALVMRNALSLPHPGRQLPLNL